MNHPSMNHPWRHIEKGGLYMVEEVRTGAGEMNGRTVVGYRKIHLTEEGLAAGRGERFSRYLDEWYDKMEPARV